ncbi:MAG: membrane protein insertion efficiency factor YidD [Candidatus Coatesbacteria bacterium]|nr:MAG: membrane protein insertion efficiency factor YidD [Candidatus Coatesbacteria bacterium]
MKKLGNALTVAARVVFVGLIRAYQYTLGPLMPLSCRFEPSCSRYAVEAIQRHGPWRGVVLAARRLLRCHPFHPGGYDPVPQKER